MQILGRKTLIVIGKLIGLNFIFKWNIAPRFGLSIFSSLYLGLLITFCVGIIFIYLEKKADCQQRIKCRRYHSSANEYRYNARPCLVLSNTKYNKKRK